jgi:hypothetical protein
MTEDYKEPDFPFRTVKPTVLRQVNKALALKLFDEVGVLPAAGTDINPKRPLPARHASMPDPMVIGRILRKENGKTLRASFLLTWWVDTSTL